MVKIIPTQKRELLTNLEVYKLVATHQEAEKAKSKGRKKANRAGKFLFKDCGLQKNRPLEYFLGMEMNNKRIFLVALDEFYFGTRFLELNKYMIVYLKSKSLECGLKVNK